MTKCKACNGTGEQFKPWLQCNAGPWLDCDACLGYGFETAAHSIRHFRALQAESAAVGWPAIYRGDLEYHDMRELAERDARLPFAWMLRETGTSMITPHEDAARNPEYGFAVCASFVNAQGPDCRLYWWDGYTLHRVNAATLIDLIRCVICFASGVTVGVKAA